MDRSKTAIIGTALVLACLAMATASARTLVVLTPHPDDAEASCGGLVANSVAAGDRVVIVTLTGGELGVSGKTPAEARALRTAEALRAATELGASLRWFGAIDGSLVADGDAVAKLLVLLRELKPDVVLAPWPLDVHPDHQATGMLAWRAFQDLQSRYALYFYETSNAPHTMSARFAPDTWVDISTVMAAKRRAVMQHASQSPASWFGTYETIAKFRGLEADVPLAEGYLRARNSSGFGGRAGHTGKTLPSED
jgi:LmbE family N-acetylglucosaminyl deacetylase